MTSPVDQQSFRIRRDQGQRRAESEAGSPADSHHSGVIELPAAGVDPSDITVWTSSLPQIEVDASAFGSSDAVPTDGTPRRRPARRAAASPVDAVRGQTGWIPRLDGDPATAHDRPMTRRAARLLRERKEIAREAGPAAAPSPATRRAAAGERQDPVNASAAHGLDPLETAEAGSRERTVLLVGGVMFLLGLIALVIGLIFMLT